MPAETGALQHRRLGTAVHILLLPAAYVPYDPAGHRRWPMLYLLPIISGEADVASRPGARRWRWRDGTASRTATG